MDLKIALRSLRHNPGFTIMAVAILALGIGANTAIFSVVNAVILRPLNYSNPDRLVSITMTFKNRSRYGQVSGPDFLDFRRQSSAFEYMAACDAGITSVVTNSTSEFAGVAEVSQDFFNAIGVQPMQGRAFGSNDRGKAQVALVSESFWQRHFGNQPFTDGRTLRLENASLDIIGILPFGFHFPEEASTEVWVPFSDNLQDENRGGHNHRVIGRLKAGVSVQQAQAQLTAIAERLAKAYPGSNKYMGVYVTQLVNFTVRNVKTSLYLLLGAVALVLLIACANVANLLLARASGRVRELAIRAALGAGQGRIIRQLFVESLLLAGAGCLGGALLAKAGLPVLLALAPKFVPRLNQITIDVPVLLFCIAAGIVASFVFGLAPALQASRVDPNTGLRVGGSRGVLGGATAKLRQIFVIAELALCMILLVSAGLLLKSLSRMTSVDLGFRPERLLVAQVNVPTSAQHANEVFYKPLLERLRVSSQVESAALTRTLPGAVDTRSAGVYIVTGQTMSDFKMGGPEAGFSVVSPGYFPTMGIPLVAGRAFSERDDANAPLVAIISESLARRSFPRQHPVGQQILCGLDLVSIKWMKIVGVVRDVRMNGPAQPPGEEIYMPYLQHPRTNFTIIVKAAGNPLSFAEAFRQQARALDPEASVKLTTMENHLASVVSTPRFSSVLISVFASLALILAIIGIYGVMAYSVSQRTAEIGLRIALGADRSDVTRMILGQALKLTSIGLIAGSIGAVAATRLLKSLLFGVSAADPATYALMLVLLAAVSLIASYIPAWRASRTEPLEALRQE